MNIKELPTYQGTQEDLSAFINEFNHFVRKLNSSKNIRVKMQQLVVQNLVKRYIDLIAQDSSGWLEKNVESLADTGESLAEAARSCGYEVPEEFSKMLNNYRQIIEERKSQNKPRERSTTHNNGSFKVDAESEPKSSKSKCCG